MFALDKDGEGPCHQSQQMVYFESNKINNLQHEG
jgi:hypothetical protein